MAYAQNTVVFDGSTDTIPVTFPYILKAHVKVTLDGVLTENFSWLNDSTVKMDVMPANGVVGRVRRETPSGDLIGLYESPSILAGRQLNDSFKQILFIAQEAYDVGGITLQQLNDAVDYVNNQSAAVAEAAEAVDDARVATLAAASQAATARDTAVSSKDTAVTAASTATSAATTASSAATTATGARDTAEAAATTAASAAITATGARDSANTYKAAAETARDQAVTAKGAAEAAQAGAETARDEAVAAAGFDPAEYFKKADNLAGINAATGRNNLNVYSKTEVDNAIPSYVLKYSAQTLSAGEKAQARDNIGAMAAGDYLPTSGGTIAGAIAVGGYLTVASGKITLKGWSGEAEQGALYFGASETHYLRYNGSNYIFANAVAYASNGRLHGSGDFASPVTDMRLVHAGDFSDQTSANESWGAVMSSLWQTSDGGFGVRTWQRRRYVQLYRPSTGWVTVPFA